MSGRPDVRGGRATRGFPPGSAQALVALVLGVASGVTGLRRDEPLWALVFFAVAALGAGGLWRLLRRQVRARRRAPGQRPASGLDSNA